METKTKIVFLGDSITEGIGSRKITYVNDIRDYYKDNATIEITNLAMSGTTIHYAETMIKKIKNLNPNIVVIMYGNVDVQEHYDLSKNRFGLVSLTPRRYKEIKSMLNPRPFISHRPIKKQLDYLDDFYRKIWRWVIVKTQGTIQFVSLDEYEKIYRYICDELSDYKIIVCSTIYPDKKIYHENNMENYCCINEMMKSIADESSGRVFVDLYGFLKKKVELNGWDSVYYRDHFHPNSDGNRMIAQKLEKILDVLIDEKIYNLTGENHESDRKNQK